MNVPLLVASALLAAFAVLWGSRARRDWSAGTGRWSGQRTIVAQAIILAGAALVVSGDGAKPVSAPPGAEALILGAVGIVTVLIGILIAVLIVTSGRPRFLIPPQGRRVAGLQGGAVAAGPARNVKSRPATAPKATRGARFFGFDPVAPPFQGKLADRASDDAEKPKSAFVVSDR